MNTSTPIHFSASAHWQPALNGVGIVEGVLDVDQSIKIILTTPKGSDPHRPWFGTDGLGYVDADPDIAAPHLLRASIDAVIACEPRVKNTSASITITPALTKINIQYRLSDDVLRETEIHL